MANTEKDRAATEVVERRVDFELALSNKRKYPVREFRAFVQTARRYTEMTEHDTLIHKSVARAVNGLREYLEVERKRAPSYFPAGECQHRNETTSFPPVLALGESHRRRRS